MPRERLQKIVARAGLASRRGAEELITSGRVRVNGRVVTELGTQANEHIQAEILRLYKTSPDVAILFELMTDFDEGTQEWRYRHVKLVERTIGAKKGTGGSLGVEFLKRSLFQPAFPDLWAIRHEL